MDDDRILEIGEDTNKLVPSTSNTRYRPVSGDNSAPRPLQVERRIAFLGHCSVGKSSIIAQFIDGHFPENYDPTIATTYTKNFRFRGRSFILHLADTAGQDEFSLEVSGCPVDVHAYILVYAINCRRSFQVVQYIYSKIIDTLGVTNFPLTLVANKMDLPAKERKISSEEGRRLAEKWNATFLEITAKDNNNVNRVFELTLVEIDKSLDAEFPMPRKNSSSRCAVS